jgi:hypothetical protein
MLHQAFGVEFLLEGEGAIRGSGYANPNGRGYGRNTFNMVQDNEILQPGDIITCEGYMYHSMIYIGCDPTTGIHQIAETEGTSNVIGILALKNVPPSFNNNPITLGQVRQWGGKESTDYGLLYIYGHASRLKPELLANWQKPSSIKIQWPNGKVSEWDGSSPDAAFGDGTGGTGGTGFFYQGIAGKVGIIPNTPWWEEVIRFFKDIFDYLTGLLTMIFRIPIVGFATWTEILVSGAVQVISTEKTPSPISIEDIIFNRVPLFDINLFNMNEAGGQVFNRKWKQWKCNSSN